MINTYKKASQILYPVSEVESYGEYLSDESSEKNIENPFEDRPGTLTNSDRESKELLDSKSFTNGSAGHL